jgi:hypothetical protein
VTGLLSDTGVGLMLGGGTTYLSRRVGYASDNVLAVELVTAADEGSLRSLITRAALSGRPADG